MNDTLSDSQDFCKLFDVKDEVLERIEIYHALLLKWQRAINLISPKSIPQSWNRHFIDSAQILKHVPQNVKIYADIGCGAGFPGLVLAIMRPDMEVNLVESDERKCQFMRTVARETGTQVTIHTKRVENVSEDFTPDFVSARALASLDKLFDYCLPWAQKTPDIGFCFMKGERAEEEIRAAQKRFVFDVDIIPSITDGSASLLLINKLACA